MATQVETTASHTVPLSLSARSQRSHLHMKPWQRRHQPAARRSQHPAPDQECESLSRHVGERGAASTRAQPKWWRIRFFRGMLDDVKRRAPYYWSDWQDAWDYRVIPATVYMYFANILPALAFSLDMFSKTDMSYGVNEVLLASVIGSIVFALAAAQPLVIVGVTGPITVFNYTVYDIVVPRGINYFAFMCWIGIWAMMMHWILAITNSCNALTYVTRFSCDIFGFYVAFIYLQKGIQVLTRQWEAAGGESAFLSVTVSLLVLGFAYGCSVLGESNLFQRHVRKFVEDYGTPLTIIFFTGFVHYGHMKDVQVETLPVSKAFLPTTDRSWMIPFWDLSIGNIFLAMPFALLLTILFWFDHNVSSLIAQGTEFPLRKPPGFHWDIFLLGLTTFIAGILGVPFPNGLIPQAPFHTNSLCVTRQVNDSDETNKGKTSRIVDHVVEQRVSNLAQGLLTLGTMTGPFLIVLHLIPQGVLAGLFFVMGIQALVGNGITQKMLFLAREKSLTQGSDPLARLERRSSVWIFVSIELLGFAATFAITQSIAAIGFPVFILLLIPVRTFLMPKWFRPEELRALDAPTAGAFVMESVGGAYGEDPDSNGTGDSGLEPTEGDAQTRHPLSGQESAIDDTLERGESYELRTQGQSQSQTQRSAVGMMRRSRSGAGRGLDLQS